MNNYDNIGCGDVFNGIIGSDRMKQFLMIDLLERDVLCVPSPLSQIISGSKVVQAFFLNKWMITHTRTILRRRNLIDAVSWYNRHKIELVVTKEDHMHCGFGVRKWDSIETLYSFMSMADSSYPFILQPLIENFTDIRVIIAGDYIESYTRYNPDNFRMNLAAGGSSSPFVLDEDKKNFCKDVMQRGKFPFAHIDIMVTTDNKCYLSEIALNGGLKGATISKEELDGKKQAIIEKIINENVK
jgi:ribosomal protein S6--L-glutamate ligase